MSNPPQDKQYNVLLPIELYEQAKMVKKITGISIASLVKDGLQIAIAEQKERINASLVDTDTLKALRENELDTGESVVKQIKRAVSHYLTLAVGESELRLFGCECCYDKQTNNTMNCLPFVIFYKPEI